MDQKTFQTLLKRTVWAPIVLLALLAGTLLKETHNLRSDVQLVNRTDQVIAAGQQLLRIEVDGETGLRGYLLTGRSEFLQPYNEARAVLPGKYDDLARKVAGNSGQQAKLEALRQLHDEWEAYAARMIELRRNGGDYSAAGINQEGKRLMDGIRRQRDDFLVVEQRLREERLRSADEASVLVTVTCIAMALLTGGLLAVFTRRQIRTLSGSFQDALSAMKAHACELEQSEQRWVTTLASIGDAVIATDAQGRITFMNELAQSLTGWQADAARGKPADEVFKLANEQTQSPMESPIGRALRLNRTVELANHAALVSQSGPQIPVEDSAAPIRDAAGNTTGAVLVFRDVTDRRRRERERAELLLREQVARAKAEEAADKLRRVHAITEAATVQLPLEKLLPHLLRKTADALDADMAVILLLNQKTGLLEVRSALGLETELAEQVHIPLGKGIAGNIAQSGRMRVVDSLTETDVYNPILQERTASLMGAPLAVDDRVIGAIHVDSNRPRHFTREETELLELVAGRVALAIDRVQREEELLVNSEQRRLALEGAELGSWEYRYDTGQTYWDKRCREILGAPEKGEANLEHALARMHPEDRAATEAAVKKALTGEADGIYHHQFRVVGLGGPVRWVASHGRVYFDAERKPLRFAGVNMDITAHRAAEDALRQSEERWATTLQSIGDAVIATDPVGRITFMNGVAESLTGWPLAEARGLDLDEVFNIVNEFTRAKPESPVAKVIRLNKVVGLANHTVLISRSGAEFPIDDSAAPIKDKKGEIAGVVLVFHDVSEQKKAEEALRASERLAVTGRLAASVAHEIHNPLDTVANLLYLLERGGADPEKMREYAAMAAQELGRVVQITRHMLSFNRESNQSVPVHVGEVLETVVALYRRKLESAGIDFRLKLDITDEVLAVPSEMRQAFANLIGNAIEAVGPKGKIRVHARWSRDPKSGRSGLRLFVADNGPGIPEPVRRRIFEPFFTTKGEGGTGLGLWITAGIIERREGKLRLRSGTRPGRSGTCFCVFLPLESAEEAGTQVAGVKTAAQ
jgi:PAS domain S-box-containing protein